MHCDFCSCECPYISELHTFMSWCDVCICTSAMTICKVKPNVQRSCSSLIGMYMWGLLTAAITIVLYHSSQVKQTALHCASNGGHSDTVRVLLERRTDSNARDRVSGMQVMHVDAPQHRGAYMWQWCGHYEWLTHVCKHSTHKTGWLVNVKGVVHNKIMNMHVHCMCVHKGEQECMLLEWRCVCSTRQTQGIYKTFTCKHHTQNALSCKPKCVCSTCVMCAVQMHANVFVYSKKKEPKHLRMIVPCLIHYFRHYIRYQGDLVYYLCCYCIVLACVSRFSMTDNWQGGNVIAFVHL